MIGLRKKIAVKKKDAENFSSSEQFRPVGKWGSENMKRDCDFDSWSKFSILLTA